jgi:hypothetical protein
MNRKVLFAVVLALFALTGYAKQRTESEAMSIARSFYEKTSKLKASVSLTLAYAEKDGTATRSAGSNAHYYIFNRDDNGFVIVSGDDRAKDILGYSDEGAFDYAAAPDNFKYWLAFFRSELKELALLPETAAQTTAAAKQTKAATSFKSSVVPLLGSIKWNQSSPFNDQCPLKNGSTRTVTGCVATAMAQVMKYWEYPAAGTGSHSYTTKTLSIPLSVDFSTATYTWADMLPQYTSANPGTTQQQAEVAELLYHCGVSVDMDYDVSSAAPLYKVALALTDYFGYDANSEYRARDFHTLAEWETLLKTELNDDRPVLYAGYSVSGSGHAFVCDGYDTNGLYHFNWGWGGSSNGYFELSALNPSSLGIGGGSGGYNTGQEMLTGIQPTTGGTITPQEVKLGFMTMSPDKTVATTSETVTVTFAKIQNISLTTFIGYFGLALYNSSDNYVKRLYAYTTGNSGLPPSSFYEDPPFSFDLSGIADGVYKIRPYIDEGSTNNSANYEYMEAKSGSPAYLTATISGTTATLSVPTEGMPNLSGSSLQTVTSLYKNRLGQLSISITNNGTGEYNSNLTAYLYSAGSQQTICDDPVVIATGETKTVELSGNITVNPGSYTLYVLYDPNNDRNTYTPSTANSLASIAVTVNAEPTGTPTLALTKSCEFLSTVKNNVQMKATIQNTSANPFVNNMKVYVFPASLGTSLTSFGTTYADIPAGQTKEVMFSGSVELEPGSYAAIIYYVTSGNSYTSLNTPNSLYISYFTLTDTPTGLQPAISDDPVISARCYDLLGKEVKQLQKGRMYIVKELRQSGKSSTKKIMNN